MPTKSILAVTLAIGAWCVLAPAQQPAPQTSVESLEARVQNVESIRAIKRLQYAYGHYVELGLWNDFADLFTDDALTNYQQGARGREQIHKLFFDQVGQGKLGLADGRIYPHILFQPVITLAPDGRSAKGRWRILAMLGGFGGSATWYSGVYENEYVLQDGVWKISVLRSEPMVTAAYTAAGWRSSGTRLPAHYTPESVTKPIPSSTSGKSAGIQDLARRAVLLNDQAAVTNVLDTYGYAVDRKQWGQAAELFANDGTLELGQQGVYLGKARIRRGLALSAPGGLNDHVYLQTLVTVAPDGLTAQARGVELIFSGDELSEGVFENTFVKQNGAWKIQSVHFYPRMIVDAAAGWAKSAKPAPGASKQLPPDRPPTSVYEIYPKFAVAPFHFNNPSTGKPPQYPGGVQTARPVPARGNALKLDVSLAAVERSLAAAEAYDVAEHLINAHGYAADGGGSLFVSQILQPVIDVAQNGRSAKVRARRLDLGGTSGGPGTWSAGQLEGQVVSQGGGWRLDVQRSSTTWTAPYPGGWGRIQ